MPCADAALGDADGRIKRDAEKTDRENADEHAQDVAHAPGIHDEPAEAGVGREAFGEEKDGKIIEETGDVLMQVLLHAQIAADAGEFTIDDVARGLNEKLIRRHPHVFGEHDAASNADEVLGIWDAVKLAEKAGRDAKAAQANERPAGLLDGVPRALPALMEAQKVSRKAAAVGFEWDTVDDVWDQVTSEREEFEREAPGSDERELEFGDMLFAMVNVARKEGIDAESALRASTAKFRRRWEAVENLAQEGGSSVEDLSTEELNRLWNQVKTSE